MLEKFGSAGSEEKHFAFSLLNYLWESHPVLITSALIRVAAKLIAYRLGGMEELIPVNLKRRLSMHFCYWV